jgi:hypothetical protein
MGPEEFRAVVSQDTHLQAAVARAAEAAPARQQLGVGEALLIAAMFPIVQFTVTRIGLPWLHEVGRYSELWRQKFHRWLDEEYRAAGFDPDQAAAAGEALAKELEQTTDGGARRSWERLRDLLLDSGQ